METSMLLIGATGAFAFVAILGAFRLLRESLRRKRALLSPHGESLSLKSLLGLRLRNGYGPLLPMADRLMRLSRVAAFADRFAALCCQRGLETTGRTLLSVLIAVEAVLFLGVLALSGSLIGAFAVALCAMAVTVVLVGNADDKRKEAMREEVPAILELMGVCFNSGFTLLQTFQQIAKEVPGYLGDLFGRSAHVLETGGSAEEALGVLRKGAVSSELAFVVAALDVQHQSGGSLQQVLDTAADSVKGELGLKRSLRVQTAQAKLSARVVIVMPFLLIALFSLISPGFLEPFFASIAGYGLLGLALIMEVAGIILVNRALDVEGVG